MEQIGKVAVPDNTAVRTALWRAMHVQVDAEPHVIEDEIGLKLIAPHDTWRQRPDMHPEFTRRIRASMVARARFIEDLIIEQSSLGISQYVILGAGLDTFAQRNPEIAATLQIFEIDQPKTQGWKQRRLVELGYALPGSLHFVPVDFEKESWWERLKESGFDTNKPAVVVSTGVSIYLTRDAIFNMLRQSTALAPGSTFAMTFYLPIASLDEEDRFLQELGEKGAREAGTPFVSFFQRDEMSALAHEAGFEKIAIFSSREMTRRYFTGRTDGLTPASGEEFLLATT